VSLFDPLFIDHSFACRIGKGTHRGVFLLQRLLCQKTLNGRRPIYLLKADIFRFFDHINHSFLKTLIQRKVHDERTLKLIFEIIDSFWHHTQGNEKFGIPLRNVTLQLWSALARLPLSKKAQRELIDRKFRAPATPLFSLSFQLLLMSSPPAAKPPKREGQNRQ
jgi:RNA-directed DNA polymerase